MSDKNIYFFPEIINIPKKPSVELYIKQETTAGPGLMINIPKPPPVELYIKQETTAGPGFNNKVSNQIITIEKQEIITELEIKKPRPKTSDSKNKSNLDLISNLNLIKLRPKTALIGINNRIKKQKNFPSLLKKNENNVKTEDITEYSIVNQIENAAVYPFMNQMTNQTEYSVGISVANKTEYPIEFTATNPTEYTIGTSVPNQIANQIEYKVGTPITNRLEDPITNRLEDPITNQIEDPTEYTIGSPITNQIKDPTEYTIGTPITNQLEDPIANQITNQTEDPIANQITNQTEDPIANQITNQTEDPIANQITNQTEYTIETSVANKTGYSIGTPITNQTEYTIETSVANKTGYPIETSVAKKTEYLIGTPITNQTGYSIGTPIANQTEYTIETSVANKTGYPIETSVANKTGYPIETSVANKTGYPIETSVANKTGYTTKKNKKIVDDLTNRCDVIKEESLHYLFTYHSKQINTRILNLLENRKISIIIDDSSSMNELINSNILWIDIKKIVKLYVEISIYFCLEQSDIYFLNNRRSEKYIDDVNKIDSFFSEKPCGCSQLNAKLEEVLRRVNKFYYCNEIVIISDGIPTDMDGINKEVELVKLYDLIKNNDVKKKTKINMIFCGDDVQILKYFNSWEKKFSTFRFIDLYSLIKKYNMSDDFFSIIGITIINMFF
jgi:hypothetical protein